MSLRYNVAYFVIKTFYHAQYGVP